MDKSNSHKQTGNEGIEKLIDKLSKSYYLRFTENYEPVVAMGRGFLEGLIVPLHSEYGGASDLSESIPEDLSIEIANITALWDTLQEFSTFGIQGVVLIDGDDNYEITFLNRLTDMDRRKPTLASVVNRYSDQGIRDFYFGLSGLINIDHEVERLEKQITDFNGRLNSVNGKLNNDNFVAKAPDSVVANEKRKQAEYMDNIQKLKENLKSLRT